MYRLKNFPLKFLFILIGTFLSVTRPCLADTFYIDFDGGNDANDGRSQGTAWRTIPGTLAPGAGSTSFLRTQWGPFSRSSSSTKVGGGTVFKLKRGSTFNALDGGYIWIGADFYADSGSAINPIRFEPDPTWGSGPVVFDGGGISVPIALILIQANGVSFDGLTPGGIRIQNSSLGGIQVKEKAGTLNVGGIGYVFKNLLFFNNGVDYRTDTIGAGSGQLRIRAAQGVTISNIELNGNYRFTNGLTIADDHMRATGVLVSNARAYSHTGDEDTNDSGIGFKTFNSEVTYRDCESFNNLKGWDFGENHSDNANITYYGINLLSHHNGWGINFNGTADSAYTGQITWYLFNSIIRDNSQWGSTIYSGPFQLYLAHNLYDNNGNDSFDAGNIRIAPDTFTDNTLIHAYVYNNIFYKPNTTKGQNYLETSIGDASSAAYDTNLNLHFDFNAWIQNTSERFARWNAFGGSHRALGLNTEFLYGPNGPGHSSGLWYSAEDDPGNGTGHLGNDPHSVGTGADDPRLPAFIDRSRNDYGLASAFPGTDLTQQSWYRTAMDEVKRDRLGRARTAWDMGPIEHGVSLPPSTQAPAKIAPAMLHHPASQVLKAGFAPRSLVCTPWGSAPISYQWKKNGVAIAGKTGPDLLIDAAQIGDGSVYSCTVTNPVGSVSSQGATVSVGSAHPTVAPTIVDTSANQTLTIGQPLNLFVSASGASEFYTTTIDPKTQKEIPLNDIAPLSYQWYKDGVLIPGAVNATYSVYSAANADAGNYHCMVGNRTGTARSRTISVSLPGGPPNQDTVSPGQPTLLRVQ